ncbi:hypothetical protein SCA6_018371 [Theobroma cacao]
MVQIRYLKFRMPFFLDSLIDYRDIALANSSMSSHGIEVDDFIEISLELAQRLEDFYDESICDSGMFSFVSYSYRY